MPTADISSASLHRGLIRYFRILQGHLGRRTYLVFVLAFLAVTTESLGIALLLPLLTLLDSASTNAATASEGTSGLEGHLHDAVGFLGVQDSVVGILVLIVGVFLLKGGLKFAEGAYVQHLGASLLANLRLEVFTRCSGADYRYFAGKNSGHFINVIANECRRMASVFRKYVALASAGIALVTYYGVAFLISWTFAAMAAVAGVGVIILFRWLNRYVWRLSVRTSREHGALNHFLVQTLHAFKYLLATGGLSPLRRSVHSSVRKLSAYQRRKGMAEEFTKAIREPLGVAVLVAVVVVQIVVLAEPVGPILVSLVLIHRAMGKVVTLQSSWQNVMAYAGSVEAVEEELSSLRERREESGSRMVGPLKHGIELDGVWASYDGGETPVLRDLDLVIPANQTIALVGESGVGKSTLVDLLALLLRPEQGCLSVDGVSHHQIEVTSWRRQIGYVPQEPIIFDDTVANNISLWSRDGVSDPAVKRRVEEAAARACALGFIRQLPQGFETRLGERGVRLSAGQRQRLSIARELYKRPSLLILDEATSALDSESERYVKESVDGLRGRTTVVVVAHRLSTIRDVDRIHVLADGHIQEEGTYEELTGRQNGRFRGSAVLQNLVQAGEDPSRVRKGT